MASLATCAAFYAGRYLTRHGYSRDGGQLARAGVSDGGFGPVAEDPGERCCHAVEVVDVLLGGPPVGRVRVEITAGGPARCWRSRARARMLAI